MGAYSYYSEGLIFSTIKDYIKGSKWSVEFGMATVQIGQGTARIVTQPIYVFNVDYSSHLVFWGVGEGTAANGCHSLAAATSARRQAMLAAMGWQQSRDDEDAEFKPSYNALVEKSPTGRSIRYQEPPTPQEFAEPVRSGDPPSVATPAKDKPKSPARIAYDQATTLADLKKSKLWNKMLEGFKIRQIDVDARFTMDWDRVPKEDFLAYAEYVRAVLPNVAEIVELMNKIYHRDNPAAIPFIFDETTSIEDVHSYVEGVYGQLDLNKDTVEFLKTKLK